MNLTKKYFTDRPWLILLILAVIGTLWKSYPHLMIPDLLPSDEYNNWVLLEVMIREGRSFDFLLSPQLQYYLMYLVHLATGISSKVLFRWTNSIIGGLSVFAFYYFASGFMDKEHALYSSVLYTFSEPFFYRSAFLGSTEILGITFMFIFLGFYLRKQYIKMVPLILVSAYIHLAPFVLGISILVADLVINKKKIRSALIIGGAVFLLIFGPFSPHRKQKIEILSAPFKSISVKNFFIYSLNELIIIGGLCYLGFIALASVTIPRIKLWNRTELIILFISTAFMLFSWLSYNSMIFSPRRMIVYMVIPMITFASRIIKKPLVYLLIISLMVIAPPLKGTQTFIWVNDAITTPELEAIRWLSENGYFDISEWYIWFSDRTVTQAVNPYIFFMRPDRDPESASYNTKEEADRMNEFVSEVHRAYEEFLNYTDEPIPTPSPDPDEPDIKVQDPIVDSPWKYVFLSERMKKQAFFLIRDPIGGDRSKEVRRPIEDIWVNHTYFTEIYNKDGVIIYEKTIN